MIAFAISYGLFTLLTLWAGAGAHPEVLASRVPIALLLYAALTAGLVWLRKSTLTFSLPQKRDTGLAAGLLVVVVVVFFALKFVAPEYHLAQTKALTALNAFAALGFALALALSDYVYRKFYAPAWGAASAAFLEALSWGLATQSFLMFAWIFASGWLVSKFAGPDSELASTALRLALGLAWIALV